jgi:glycosyltransferase involved in cell wall biosynthesis
MVLTVIVVTYNQEKYIEECIYSILNQKTNFDFNILIGDDCSTDKTTLICQNLSNQFSQIKLLIPSKNQGFMKNFLDCYNAAQSKYIGITGGDDYWIDELKLQKQVDFLEQNVDYSLCCTGYKYYFEDTATFKEMNSLEPHDILYNDLLYNNPIIPTTVVCKKELIKTLENDFLKAPVEDWILWLRFGQLGKIRYINEVTSIYRQHSTSMYSGLPNGKRSLWRFKTALYINTYYRKQTIQDFFKYEKYYIISVFSSSDLTIEQKNVFLNELKALGLILNRNFRFLFGKSKMSNFLIRKYLNYKLRING